MSPDKAQTAITLSALVTTGMFAYRKITEPELQSETVAQTGFIEDYRSIFGAAPPIGWGQYLKGAGSLFILLAIIGAASPEVGGSLAVLIGASALLGNLIAVRGDLQRTEQEQKAAEQAVRGYKPATGQAPTSGHVLRRI